MITETSEFFHPLMTKFGFKLVESLPDEDFKHHLYSNNTISILVTDSNFGSYWQQGDKFGSWAILEDHLNTL